MHDEIIVFLTESVYHSCLLIVHPDVRRLEQVADELTATYSWPRLSVGKELSKALLAEASARRSGVAQRWLDTRLRELTPTGVQPVLCTQIDLLFEPDLRLDPLRLLREASRTARILVVWPGSYKEQTLAYAVPDHSHYRTWRQPDLQIVCL